MPPENNTPLNPQPIQPQPEQPLPPNPPNEPQTNPPMGPEVPETSPLIPTYPPVTATAPPPKGPSDKLRFIIIAAVIILVVGAGVAAALYFTKDDSVSDSLKLQAAEQTSSVPNESQAEPTETTADTTADTVSTLCFSFNLPTPHQEITTENDCVLGNYYYGADNVAAISVSPFAHSTTSLDEMIAFWKKNNASLTTVQKEEKFKLGVYDAVKIVHKAGANGNTTQTVLVYTDNKYKLQNVTFEGFEIIGLYSDQYDSIKGYDSILASWQWK